MGVYCRMDCRQTKLELNKYTTMEKNNEQFNWISAKTIFSGKRVIVRQDNKGSEFWIDAKGVRYHISDLDFTK